MCVQRQQWRETQANLDATRLVFLDESGINTEMTRIYGPFLHHQRVREGIPVTRFERTSILTSVRLDGTMVPLVFEGALNGDLFRAYVERMLPPSLHLGDIVIMDNLTSHQVKGIAEAIEAAGAHVMYLLPYSPDLNPIELFRSKVKAILRKLKVRAKERMDQAISQALDAITLDDIAHWFRHDGYAL